MEKDYIGDVLILILVITLSVIGLHYAFGWF